MEPARVQTFIDDILIQLRAVAQSVAAFLDMIIGWIAVLEAVLPKDVLFVTDFLQALVEFFRNLIV